MELLLYNPKYVENLASVVRLASAWGVNRVIYTGNRIQFGERIPRELRMYKNVELLQNDRPINPERVYVAVEFRDNAETLFDFSHPPGPCTYVFGPEDGSIPQVYLRHCQRFIVIPTAHCLNLATAVATVLYDRKAKEQNYDPQV